MPIIRMRFPDGLWKCIIPGANAITLTNTVVGIMYRLYGRKRRKLAVVMRNAVMSGEYKVAAIVIPSFAITTHRGTPCSSPEMANYIRYPLSHLRPVIRDDAVNARMTPDHAGMVCVMMVILQE